jgi:hypothetical protein
MRGGNRPIYSQFIAFRARARDNLKGRPNEEVGKYCDSHERNPGHDLQTGSRPGTPHDEIEGENQSP